MLSVGTVVIGVHDLHRAVAFWTQALNYVPKREVKPDDDFMILVPAAGEGTHLALDVSETLGATRVDWDRYPENADFVVMADTEDNRFCVIDTSD